MVVYAHVCMLYVYEFGIVLLLWFVHVTFTQERCKQIRRSYGAYDQYVLFSICAYVMLPYA